MQAMNLDLPTGAAAIHFSVDASRRHAHLYTVCLHLAQAAPQQRVSLPAWIPGSYLLREFSQHLQNITASSAGAAVALVQLNKNTWQLALDAPAAVCIRYEVYAFDASVRTAWLDSQRGFFNPTSLCLMVAGQTAQPHSLSLASGNAQDVVVTAATAGPAGYAFDSYDALADTPFLFGSGVWQGEFEAAGIAHRFAVVGAPPNFDGERLLADSQAICTAQCQFWGSEAGHQAIFQDYTFLLHASDDAYGGLEHSNSTMLIASRSDLPLRGAAESTAGYRQLLGLISHEYFHSWNVKRMRPSALVQYDYEQENYTELLWFFEGFTSYYDDLFLCRSGRISPEQYVALISRSLQALERAPGVQVQSVAEASFDAWVKYYRQDENTLNATVSYYLKGAWVALSLDLTLRREGRGTLDGVMRRLWALRGAQAGGQTVHGITEADIALALAAEGGRSFAPELAAWVHGRSHWPLDDLLATVGIQRRELTGTWAQRLGVVLQAGSALQLKTVLRDSAAEQAGLAAGDVLLGLEWQGERWHVRQLEQLDYLMPQQDGRTAPAQLLWARDGRILTGVLPSMAGQSGGRDLQLVQPELAAAWLGLGH